MRHTPILLGLLLGLSLLALAAKDYSPPRVYPAKTYPARDEHSNEHVTIAADPYDTPDKAAPVFALPYGERDFLPIFLIITNDGDQSVTLQGMRIQLVTVDRTKLAPANSDDLYRRFTHLRRRGDEPSRNPLPIPLPRRSKAGISTQGVDEIERAPFRAQAVEPHASQAGFFFFDVEGIGHPLAGAHLYITGVRDGNGNELMFFDIPLEKYLSYKP